MELTKEEQTLVIELLERLFEEGFGGEVEDRLFEKLIGAVNGEEES
ncbi:hypothetical protein [Morganella morganii]|nr:hypothetical protein [Morganella morganii]HDU8700526.1 hypothetical protein [Morganella morganii subsp. morganii]CDK64368.1 hypothetical protein [Morganella morganii IS15]HAU5616753.1 hypothetical protein [Morganella morganii]HCU2396487.1 hypothetical protein [Morganella morganii]HDQ2581195.1 hypothetical protein [Morganella morganii]